MNSFRLWRDCWSTLRDQGSEDLVYSFFALVALIFFPFLLLWELVRRNMFVVCVVLYALLVNALVVWWPR